MPKRRCPKCRADARYLDKPSKLARVDVYVCDKCDYLWSVRKVDSDTTRKRLLNTS